MFSLFFAKVAVLTGGIFENERNIVNDGWACGQSVRDVADAIIYARRLTSISS
jgi:hypothetical protein